MIEGDTAPVSETVATPVPAEPVASTGEDVVVDVPREVKSDPVPAPKEVEKKPVSTLDAVKKAAEKVEAGEKAKTEAVKATPKPVEQPAVKPKEAPVVAEAPKVAEEAKTAATDDEKPYKTPPSRWNPDAKKAWEALPDDNLKNEVYRTVSELEKGYQKHREGAEKWKQMEPLEALAKQKNVDVFTAAKNYVAIDTDLSSDNIQHKLRALDEVFRVAGIDKAAFAKHVLGNQAPQQQSNIQHVPAQQPQQPQESPKLKQLEQTVEKLTKHLEQQQEAQIDQEWQAWSKDKPLANDLLEPIQHYLNEGLNLDESYERAKQDLDERLQSLGYAPMSTRPAAQAIPNGKTTKSLTGAPSAGSTPATSPRSKNPADAVKRAMQIAGMA